MPNHSLRSDYSAEILRGQAARLPALQNRYAMAIARLYDGDEIEAVARAADVQPHTVRRWMYVFNEQGIAGFSNAIIGGTYELRRDFDAQSVRAFAQRVYSPATKARLFAIAQMYEGVPTREIARLAGVSEGRLSEWRQNFNTAKIVAQGEVENRQLQANARVRGNYWTADKVAASIQKAWDDEHRRKLEVVKLSLEGKSVDSIVKLTGGTRAEVVTWIRVFEAGGPKALMPSDAAKKPARAASPTASDGTGAEVGQSEKNARRSAVIPNPAPSSQEIGADSQERMEGKKAIPRGQAINDRSLSEATDKVVDFFTTLLEDNAEASANATDAISNKTSKANASALASQPVEIARKGKSGRGSVSVVATDEVVKRGRGRPRKDGQPNKSTALLMKMAAGIKNTVKRIAKDAQRPSSQAEAQYPIGRSRAEIPFTTLHLKHFLAEAVGDEHARRLQCMLLLKDGGGIARASKKSGVSASKIAEWRDAFIKDGPAALIPDEALQPYRVSLTVQQAAVLKAIKPHPRDVKSKVATALLMLNDKRYPPFVADTVGASVDNLRDWVRDVEIHAGPRTAGEVWKRPAAAQKKPEVAAPRGLNTFQNQILEVVNQAHHVKGSDAAIARVARRNGVPLPLVERWLDKMQRHGVEALVAETAAVQVRMPETSSAKELRRLASSLSQPTANELKALAYLYDGASIAMAARISRMSKDDLTELVLDFNMLGLEALGLTENEPRAMAAGM